MNRRAKGTVPSPLSHGFGKGWNHKVNLNRDQCYGPQSTVFDPGQQLKEADERGWNQNRCQGYSQSSCSSPNPGPRGGLGHWGWRKTHDIAWSQGSHSFNLAKSPCKTRTNGYLWFAKAYGIPHMDCWWPLSWQVAHCLSSTCLRQPAAIFENALISEVTEMQVLSADIQLSWHNSKGFLRRSLWEGSSC